MRRRLEGLARRWWAGELGWAGAALSAVLAPLSWLWAAGTAARNARWDRRGGAAVEGLTVVSVGNLAVGGTGKTPVASWIARRCRALGRTPAILLSGYGRDEELLHRRWTPAIATYADADRVAAARRARTAGADVAILDDGFQHRRLGRAVDLVLLALEDPFPGRTLPRGRYREGPAALARASGVLITRRSGSAEQARRLADRVEAGHRGLVRGAVWLTAGAWTRLDGTPATPPEADVLVVTGVARPREVVRAVGACVDGAVELLAFPDHHEYAPRDLDGIEAAAAGRPVVVTEKDAVKLEAHAARLRDAYVLGESLSWDWGEEEVGSLLASSTGAGAP